MLTNTIAIAITILAVNSSEIKTNVTESFTNPSGPIMYWINPSNGKPEEKWVTTVVVREDKLTFFWNGQPQTMTDTTVLSSNVVHLKVKQDWEEVK